MIFFLGRNKNKSGLHDLSDHELILSFKKNTDSEIIAEIFTRYTHLVYGVCLKYLDDKDDAKDAVLEIFEGLMDSIPEHEIRNFKNWLYSVTRNHCLMVLRKEKSSLRLLKQDPVKIHAMFVESDDEPHQQNVLDEDALKALDYALQELKEPQRICLEMVYLKNKSYQEVCEITGFSMMEVKSHVQNGKRNLKIRLGSAYAKED